MEIKEISELYEKMASGEIQPEEISNYLTDEMLLKEVEARIKEFKIILEYSEVGCYNCDAMGATGLTIKGYHIDFADLADEVEKRKGEARQKEIEEKSKLFKDFNDSDLRTELWRREKELEEKKNNEAFNDAIKKLDEILSQLTDTKIIFYQKEVELAEKLKKGELLINGGNEWIKKETDRHALKLALEIINRNKSLWN